VSDVNLSENRTGWHIHVSGRPDMMLANWAIGKRKQLFEQVFGVSLQIH
jgi:hypothetical protein